MVELKQQIETFSNPANQSPVFKSSQSNVRYKTMKSQLVMFSPLPLPRRLSTNCQAQTLSTFVCLNVLSRDCNKYNKINPFCKVLKEWRGIRADFNFRNFHCLIKFYLLGRLSRKVGTYNNLNTFVPHNTQYHTWPNL